MTGKRLRVLLAEADSRETAEALHVSTQPVPVDVSEFHKSGGSMTCPSAEMMRYARAMPVQ